MIPYATSFPSNQTFAVIPRLSARYNSVAIVGLELENARTASCLDEGRRKTRDRGTHLAALSARV